MIPFLFFAFTGTTILTVIGLTSQQSLIKQEERKMLLLHFRNFQNEMDQKCRQAISMVSIIAENEQVKRLFKNRDREGLNDLLVNTYVRLKVDFDISQFHFHIPPGISFLRLHEPKRYGDILHKERGMITDVLKRYLPVSGLEKGETGFGLRGVVPVFWENDLIGTVEIGHSFGRSFLHGLHKRWGIEVALYQLTDKGNFELMTSVPDGAGDGVFAGPDPGSEALEGPKILIAPEHLKHRAILQSPIHDYKGDVVAFVELSVDRSDIRKRLRDSLKLMVFVGALGIAISFVLTYMVAIIFTNPIKKIVKEAGEIAEEKRENYLEPGPGDEIGTLTLSLNRMLAALMERRDQIREYAKNLEKRVQERTQDLVASEEKYRTLVENVPLIVYRILEDGTTEFINTCLTESLGYTIEEAVGDRLFWKEKILGDDEDALRDLIHTCFEEAEECRVERIVQHKDGQPLIFLDHALPAIDYDGRVRWVDGIMMDITELKELQERALRTEETRILGEISARMAHEIRNPLSAAGGFARRLRNSLRDEDPNRKIADIIVKEVARMETFLRILLTSIQPFDLSLTTVDLNSLIRTCVDKFGDLAASRNIDIEEILDEKLPSIQGDLERLSQTFDSLVKHAIVTMVEGDTLRIQTRPVNSHIRVRMAFLGGHISEDDLGHFFFPHLEHDPEKSVLDLPLSKIIIHRHGGRIRVFMEGDRLITEIEFQVFIEGDVVQ